MDTTKLKFTRLQADIFRFLCENADREFNQSFIANELRISSTAVAKALGFLKEQKLAEVNKNEKMNLNLIRLNRESAFTIHLKRAENLKRIYESGILEFLEENFPGATIILFGSYSKGEDVAKSDIDLAIIGKKEKHVNLSGFEKILKKEIIMNFYSSMKEIDKELRESLCNGIVLSGSIKL